MSKRKAAPKTERRALKQPIEVRVNADGSRTVKGIAAPFGKMSVDLGGFREVIAKGAFTRTLKDNPDVLLLRQHDAGTVLARTTSGTLKLRETDKGLEFEANLSGKSTIANDTIDAMQRGDLDAMSFGFNLASGNPDADDWVYVNDTLIRTLNDVDLGEVSIVSFPAYPDSSAALRTVPAHLRSKIKRSDSPADIDNGGDLDCDGEDADDPECQEQNSKRDDGDDTECPCVCDNCEAGNCEMCSAETCTDTRCERCAVQARDGLRMKILFAHRRN
jgi:uncharacterized protein